MFINIFVNMEKNWEKVKKWKEENIESVKNGGNNIEWNIYKLGMKKWRSGKWKI